MSKDGVYYTVSQEYSKLKRQKRELTKERNIINAKLEIIEDILIALDVILCKHGRHIYEHFREGEPQECEPKEPEPQEPEPQECEPEKSEASDE